MKRDSQVEDLCRKLKPLIKDQAEKLWHLYLAEDENGRKQLALDIEIIAEKLLNKTALADPQALLPPPVKKNTEGRFYIGQTHYNHKNINPIYLRTEDFIRQVGIFSITGQGKTNLAYLMAIQLVREKIPFLVIDWKRSWRNLLSLKKQIPELNNVQVFTIGRDVVPFLWNPFRAPQNANIELWISTISEALEKSHLSGLGVAYYINKIYLKNIRRLKSKDFFPNFFDGLREIESIKAFERELKWQQTARRIFQSFTIGSAAKAFNSRNPLKLEKLLDKPVIIELDLEMPKPLRIFFTEIIIRWIHLYRLNQGESEQLRHVLFLEEVHNLFEQYGFYKDTSNLENVYREIRAFGQGIVSITQHPSKLPIYLLGNCHTQIYLGLQHEDDIAAARKSLFLKRDQEHYLNLLRVGESIIKIKNRTDPCLFKIPLVPVKSGLITDKWLKLNMQGYLPSLYNGKKQSDPRYLPPDKYKEGKNGKNHTLGQSNHLKLLVDIFKNPLRGITRRYKKLRINPKFGNEAKNHLVSNGYIKQVKIITGKGWIILFDLTPKGKYALRDLGYKYVNSSEGILHRYWKHQVAEHYRKKNFIVLVEKNINGRPDIIVANGDKKAAIEIETGKSNVISNIQRSLKAGFDEIICAATNRTVEEKIIRDMKKHEIADERIKVTNVFAFVV